MADLGITGLKTEVGVQIYTNHNQAITGAIMNDTLIDTIDTLKNGGNLDAKSVDTAQLADNAVEALQINTGAVTEAKIASGAVTGDKIATGAITHAKIGANAIDGSNIQDGSITESEIYEGSINEGHLQMNCVTEEKIATDAVKEYKIAASAVTNTKIASGAVTEAKIGSGAVTTSKLGAKAVTREKIADDAASYVAAIKENVDSINVDNLGDVRAKSIDMDELPKVCSFPMYIISETAPNVVPDFVSQHWIDTIAKKVYIAVGVSSSADFVALN